MGGVLTVETGTGAVAQAGAWIVSITDMETGREGRMVC